MLVTIFFVFCVSHLVVVVSAATYCDAVDNLGQCYVDGEVDDSGDGKTPDTAFKTIQEAAAVIGPGDTINVKGDQTYQGGIVISADGTASDRILITAWSDTGIPTIDIGSKNFGWAVDGDYVTINGFQVIDSDKQGVPSAVTTVADYTIISNNILLNQGLNGVNLHYENDFVFVINNLVVGNKIGVNCNTHQTNNQVRNNIFVNNEYGILGTTQADHNLYYENDNQYFDSSTITIGANEIEADPEFIDYQGQDFRLEADSPSINNGLDVSKVDFDILNEERPIGSVTDIGPYEFEGPFEYYVDGEAGDDSFGGTEMFPFQTIQAAADVIDEGDVVNVKGGVTYTTANPCTQCYSQSAVACVTHSGSEDSPITFQPWEGFGTPVIDASDASQGFCVDANYITIDGFEIFDAGENVSSDNENNIRIIASDEKSRGATVKNCQIHHASHGIVGEGADLLIFNNVIHDHTHSGLLTGFYSSAFSFKIFNNIVSDNEYAGIFYYSATTPENESFIQNNIIMNNKRGIKGSSNFVVTDHNLFFDNDSHYQPEDQNSHDVLDQDPLIRDFSEENFRLKEESPAIDAGVLVAEVSDDLYGLSRPKGGSYDIGPSEYTQYYVDGESGDDDNEGSIDSPWKTIQQAADTVVAGDVVNVKGGLTYTRQTDEACWFSYGAVVCLNGETGTEDNPIVFQSWQGTGVPKIDGEAESIGFFLNKQQNLSISGFHITNTRSYGLGMVRSKQNTITNNLISDMPDAFSGIYTGWWGDNQVIHNTVDDSAWTCYHSDGTVSETGAEIVKNNIFSNCQTGVSTNGGAPSNDVVSESNLFWDVDQLYGSDNVQSKSGDLEANPHFVDQGSGNYRLSSDSPAIDSGVTLPELQHDILGIERPLNDGYDRGAYEWHGFSLKLLKPTGIIRDQKPDYRFNVAQNDLTDMKWYKVSVDYNKPRKVVVDGITPPMRVVGSEVTERETESEQVVFFYDDSDSKKDEVMVSIKDGYILEKGLSEGVHRWQLEAEDTSGYKYNQSAQFGVDLTAPKFRDLAISDVVVVEEGAEYSIKSKDSLLKLGGVLLDPYEGSTVEEITFSPVSSGPHKILVGVNTVEETASNEGDQREVSKSEDESEFEIEQVFSFSDVATEEENDTQGIERSRRFYLTMDTALIPGRYEITVRGFDEVNNSRDMVFRIEVKGEESATTGSLYQQARDKGGNLLQQVQQKSSQVVNDVTQQVSNVVDSAIKSKADTTTNSDGAQDVLGIQTEVSPGQRLINFIKNRLLLLVSVGGVGLLFSGVVWFVFKK